jgi:glycosyltransferase involved in cell wall biosynthesis
MPNILSFTKQTDKTLTVPVFSILIPTWNNLSFLQLCIESIRKNSKYAHQLIVHINEGIDGTVQWIKEQGIDYTYSKENAGVCHALNEAYKLAVSDYILYINDDMYVCPDWDEALWNEIKAQSDEKFYLSATAIEPVDVNKKIAIAPHFYGLDPENFEEERLLLQYKSFSFSDWCGSSWPPSVVHRKMWDAVGGYSIEFSPGFYSDPDFSMKLWQAGVRRFKGVSESRVYHFLESSTKRLNSAVIKKGNHLFLEKWGITARAFYHYYLRMGEPYRELTMPANKPDFLWKKFLCKIKRLFI